MAAGHLEETSTRRPAAENAQHAEHGETLLAAFRHRARSLWGGGRRLRLITGLALAQVLVAAALVTAHDLPMPVLSISTTDNRLIQMGVPIFVLTMVFIALAWSYLLSGALHAHPVFRVLGLVLYTVAFGSILYVVKGTRPYAFVGYAILALVWAIGIWSLVRYRRHRTYEQAQHPRALRMATFIATFVLTGALYADGWLASVAAGSHLLFTLAFTTQLATLQFVLVPMLMLAAGDFSEWAEVGAQRVVMLTGRGWPWLVAVAALVSVAVIAAVAWEERIWVLPQVLLGLLFIGLLGAVVRRSGLHLRTLPEHLPILALIIVAILLTGVLLSGAVFSALGSQPRKTDSPKQSISFTTYNHEKEPRFSLEYPTIWSVKVLAESPNESGYAFTGLDSGDPAVIYVLAFPSSAVTGDGLTAWLKTLKGYEPDVAPPGARAGREFTLRPAAGATTIEMRGIGLTKVSGNLVWIVYGAAPSKFSEFNTPIFEKAIESWRPAGPLAGPEKPGAASKGDSFSLVGWAGIAWFFITCLTVGFLLLRGRRSPGALVSGSVVLLAVGAFATLSALPATTRMLRLTPNVDLAHFPGLRYPGVQAGAAVATLALIAWITFRGRRATGLRPLLPLLLALDAGLQIISWLYGLYDNAIHAETAGPAVQAAIILVAFAWDIVMAGGALTSVNGRWFTRQARVLLYFGYVMLTSAAILYFGSFRFQATGGAVENSFQTDFWVQAGLVQIGVPLLAAFFVLKLVRLWRRGQPAEPAGEASAA